MGYPVTTTEPASPGTVPVLRSAFLQAWLPGGLFHDVGPEFYGVAWEPAVAYEQALLRTAEMYWVSSDMTTLLEMAAPTMPAQPLAVTDLPSPAGFVVLERPIVGWDAMNAREISVWAFGWGIAKLPGPPPGHPAFERHIPAGETTDYLGTFASVPEKIPACAGVAIVFYTREMDAERGYQGMWAPAGRSDWPFGDDTEDDPWWAEVGGQVTADKHTSAVEDRRWLAAFWTLIAQRNLVHREPAQVARHVRRQADRAGLPITAGLSIVRLRREYAEDDHEPVEGGKVAWSRRWMVEGHWRNQYLPSTKTHRQQFIAPYVKGPTDKPLVVRENVVRSLQR